MATEPTGVKTTDVKLTPYKRGADYLIADVRGSDALHITDRDYHSSREKIMSMRNGDPSSFRLYDQYLSEVVEGGEKGGKWSQTQINELDAAINRHGVFRGGIMNDIGRDLKIHKYDTNYRPVLAIDVNGRPMHPEVVVRQYKKLDVDFDGQFPTSHAPGDVRGGMTVKKVDAQKLADLYVEMNPNIPKSRWGFTETMLHKELAEHGRKFGVVGKFAAGVAVAGVGMVQGASAAEIAVEAGDAMIPAVGSVSAAVLSDDRRSRRGHLCDAFGQVAGAGSGIGAGLTVGAATSLTGPGAVALGTVAGVATEAVVTPAATNSCNWVAEKLGL